MLEQLIYVSTARDPLRSVMDVSDILEQSVRNNAAGDVTGALAFTLTRFVQLLEGPAASLDALLLKLNLDARHHDLVVIDRTSVPERAFPDWSMLAPVFTPEGQARLADLMASPVLAVEIFRVLLLDMIAEQSIAVRAHFPDDPVK